MAGKGAPFKFTDDEIEEALFENHGVIAATLAYLHGKADGAGRVDPYSVVPKPVRMLRTTLIQRLNKSERLKAAREECLETIKDCAEHRVFSTITGGGPNSLRAATWFLERRGADRGYSPRADAVKEIADELLKRYSLPEMVDDQNQWLEIAKRHREEKRH